MCSPIQKLTSRLTPRTDSRVITLTASNDVFAENDQIVLSDGFTYGLSDDNLGTPHTLVSDTKIYGVLFQKSAWKLKSK